MFNLRTSFSVVTSLLLLVCSGSDEQSADASLAPASDASQGQADSRPGPDAQASTQPEYDAQGCLTFDSAVALCDESDQALCNASVDCGHSDLSQCSIDCTMATTLCLESTQVEACRAAVASGSCTTISECQGWLYF